MANAKKKKPSRKALMLGVGLDSDGHKRLTTGPNFALVGGTAETHESMTEKAIKINEKLRGPGQTVGGSQQRGIRGHCQFRGPAPSGCEIGRDCARIFAARLLNLGSHFLLAAWRFRLFGAKRSCRSVSPSPWPAPHPIPPSPRLRRDRWGEGGRKERPALSLTRPTLLGSVPAL